MSKMLALAALACVVVLCGCVPMQWQIDRMKNASIKWGACINSEADNASSHYGNVDLVIEQASLACSREMSAYHNSLFGLEYSREQAQKETERVETAYLRLARLRLTKRNADFDKAWGPDPVPMEIK